MKFLWKKDGQDIVESSNIEIQSIKDSSFLFIESVTAKSSGNYTCIVTNSFGSDKFTATLTVTGMFPVLVKYLCEVFLSILNKCTDQIVLFMSKSETE